MNWNHSPRAVVRFVACSAAFATFFFAATVVDIANAGSPALSVISPQGGQRGTEVEITFAGDRLDDAQEILFSRPGISMKSLEVKNPKSVLCKLAIAPDAELGIYAARVRTASGISNLQTFHVGALPSVEEVEPNSEFEAPQPVGLDVTVVGVVQNEDVDYFVVDAKKGERITAEIEGLRLGRTFFDPYVGIFDARRFELAGSDDAALIYQDAIASIVAPEDGKYIIQVRESSFQGNGACTYRLHLGHFPRPTAVYPAGGKPGETLEVRWLGDAAGERKEQVTIPADAGEDFYLFAKDSSGIAPSGNPFRANNLANTLEVEPNNGPTEGTPAEVPGALNGILSEPGDTDYFKIKPTTDLRVAMRVHARSIRTPVDPVLSIHSPDGKQLTANDDSGGPDSFFNFNLKKDQEYVIQVRDHLGAGGANYVYRVEVTPTEPSLETGIPERQQYVATLLTVPRANRGAIMISAKRAGFAGDLNIDLKDLPAGVTFETVPMPGNRNEVPVLLTATADAALAGARVNVIGRPVDPEVKLEGILQQRNWMVRGQGNSDVWRFWDNRMSMALTEEAPFEIEIIQPKVPLVQRGSLNLKIVAKRKEGFTAAIPVQLLYNPPGVSSSGSIKIPENANEVVIPLSAAQNAAPSTWKIVAVAQANVNGNIEVASRFADITIEEPYVSFAFPKAAVEQGQTTDIAIDVEHRKEFAGGAKVELVGLPAGTTAEPLELTKDMKQLSFKVETKADAREGRHTSLHCRLVIEESGEQVNHVLGPGELRVDKPLPPKVNAPAKPATPAAAAAKPAPTPDKPKEKPLSRLEQLRLERKQAAEAGK